MKLWPYVLDLTVGSPERERPVHVWIPLFLLWPLMAIVAVLVFVVTVVVDAMLVLVGRPYHHYTLLVYRTLALLSDARGLIVRVKEDRNVIDMTLY